MSGELTLNTRIAWDEEFKDFQYIGDKSQWNNTGLKDGTRTIWTPKLNNEKPNKADPKRNYYCCHILCNSMIVNQGPVNDWFFSRKSSRKKISKCKIQSLFRDFANSTNESEKHRIAKEVLFDYLNSDESKKLYKISEVVMEERITKNGIVIQPDIKIVHTNERKTFVEIVNFSSPHKNNNAWKFYESNPDLVIIDIKGNQEGWYFKHFLLRQILIAKFEYAYQNKGKNHIQLWEEANQAIAYCEEQSRNFSFAKLIAILESSKKERNDKINSVQKEYLRIYEEFKIMLSEESDDYLLKNNLTTLLRKHSDVDNEISFDRGITDYSKRAWRSVGPYHGGFYKKYSKAGIENYVLEFKNKYQEIHTRFSDLEFFYQHSTKELFYNKQVIIDQTGFAQECHINLKILDEKIDQRWIEKNKILLNEAEDLFHKFSSLRMDLNNKRITQSKSENPLDALEALGFSTVEPKWMKQLTELNGILGNDGNANQFARRFVKSGTGKRVENEDGSVTYLFDTLSIVLKI